MGSGLAQTPIVAVRHACPQRRAERFSPASTHAIELYAGHGREGRKARCSWTGTSNERIGSSWVGSIDPLGLGERKSVGVASCGYWRRCVRSRLRRCEGKASKWRVHSRRRHLSAIGESSKSVYGQWSNHITFRKTWRISGWRSHGSSSNALVSSCAEGRVKRLRHVEVVGERSRPHHSLTIVTCKALKLCPPVNHVSTGNGMKSS